MLGALVSMLGGYRDDAMAYFALLSTQPSADKKDVINRFFARAEANSYNNKILRLWIWGMPHQQSARVSLYNHVSEITEVNSPTWTANQGYTGNGTSTYLDLGIAPSGGGSIYTQNSASIFFYSRTNVASVSIAAGSINGANRAYVYPRRSDGGLADKSVFNINGASDNGGAGPASVTDSRGFFHQSRTGSTTITQHRNGTLLYSSSNTSNSPSSRNFYGMALNSGGTAAAFDTRQYAIMGFGAGDINASAFNTDIQELATGLGFSV